MSRPALRKLLVLPGVFLLVWLFVRFLLPIALPFLLGTGLAMACEKAVARLSRRLPRPLAALICVTGALAALLAMLTLLASLIVRELGLLAAALPSLWDAAQQGLLHLQDFLLSLIARTPAGVRTQLTASVLDLLGSGSTLIRRAVEALPAMASGILSGLPDSALTLGTGILSAYMISARLPKIRELFRAKAPSVVTGKYLPALRSIRRAVGGWMKAQCKLCFISFLILTGGLLALQVSYAPLWGLLIAIVDALPLLGTGSVLLPWALFSFLRGNPALGAGLLGIYTASTLTRSTLEPRLVGRQLGIDPLLTLVALYAGWRLWGVAGMLFAPMLAVVAGELSGISR